MKIKATGKARCNFRRRSSAPRNGTAKRCVPGMGACSRRLASLARCLKGRCTGMRLVVQALLDAGGEQDAAQAPCGHAACMVRKTGPQADCPGAEEPRGDGVTMWSVSRQRRRGPQTPGPAQPAEIPAEAPFTVIQTAGSLHRRRQWPFRLWLCCDLTPGTPPAVRSLRAA